MSLFSKKRTSEDSNQQSERIEPQLESETAQKNGTAETISTPDRETIKDAEFTPDSETSISIYDPGSQKTVFIHGDIVTGSGGSLELKDNLRQLLIASSNGEIYFSRSHQHSPHVLSEIKRIETIIGRARLKQPIDMSSLAEMYHRASLRGNRKSAGLRTDVSSMQRALISIVANAASKNASDIHIIVNTNSAVTKFRVDGDFTQPTEMQPQYAFELLSAAFAMADQSDPAYQPRQYQAARISSLSTELPNGVQALRLQFNPLANEGRYLIMRLLYSGSGKDANMSDLGYSHEQIRQISTMSARPVGINIISGPTGSGKSTTLKAVLEAVIKKRGNKINTITIEDPPEYIIKNTQQMPVTGAKTQEERAEKFTQAISAGLRSDPDILMIGEIRDKASADLAVEGALSGHPIYASLHANTAMDILTRLRDMGIDDFKVYDANVFSGLIGQRLIGQICPHCRKTLNSAIEADEIDTLVLERIERMREMTPKAAFNGRELYVAGEGCSHCREGYKGRAVVAEIILPDDDFMDLMKVSRKSEARSYWFEKMNGLDLLGSSWLRAIEGRLSPVDIEHNVALLAPLEAHRYAFDYWTRKLGMLE